MLHRQVGTKLTHPIHLILSTKFFIASLTILRTTYMNKIKYIIIIVGLILIPIALNFILQIPCGFPIIGDSKTWLSFWGSFIGALASFAMIVITIHTLKQNKLQLDEMKRQWEEEHRPHLMCHVTVYKKAFFLQITNPSKYDASNVIVRFGDELIQNIDSKFKEMYVNTSLNPIYIPAGKSWNCMIGGCEEVNENWKDKNFEITVDANYNEKYNLHAVIPIKTFVNRINMLVRNSLEDYVEDLVLGLVKPHSVIGHKTVQVSLEEISKTLHRIVALMSKSESVE